MNDPLVAVIPGVWDPWVRVDTHPASDEGDGQVLEIHLTRYPVPDEDQYDHSLLDTLNLHTLATAPLPFQVLSRRLKDVRSPTYCRELQQENDRRDRRARNGATVVVGGAFGGDSPQLVLDAMMRRYLNASVVGVQIDDQRFLVGMRTRQLLGSVNCAEDDAGFVVSMTGDKGAPAALFPSALHGWSCWWRRTARDQLGRAVAAAELPQPPLELDIIEAWKRHRVRLGHYERTAWPQLPGIPRVDFGDDGI